MTFRIYLMPLIGDGLSPATARTIKYRQFFGKGFNLIPYGPEPVCIVGGDVTPEEHNSIMLNTDVRAFPANIDMTINNQQRSMIINLLDTFNIPGQWITIGMSIRIILRRLVGKFLFLQSLHGKGLRLPNNRLDSTLSELSSQLIESINNFSSQHRLNNNQLNNQSSIRNLLTNFGAQFENKSFFLKGMQI